MQFNDTFIDVTSSLAMYNLAQLDPSRIRLDDHEKTGSSRD